MTGLCTSFGLFGQLNVSRIANRGFSTTPHISRHDEVMLCITIMLTGVLRIAIFLSYCIELVEEFCPCPTINGRLSE